jgi:signal-transduction protein with cAMP-binding, CBS, and nucleotidyltransferase domain
MKKVALIAPAVPINKELRQYKMEQDVVLQNSLAKIRKQLKENHLDATKRMDLREDYKFQQSIREDLHRMRTWPYGIDANLQ